MPPKINDGLDRFQRYRKRHPERVRQTTANWRKNNPKKVKQVYTDWRKRNPEKWTAIKRKSDLNSKLGEGAFDHFEEQRQIQGGKCAICNQPMQKACSDHCHESGQWRGLLCDSCNRGLGLLRDSVEVLESAIAYLKYWVTA